MYNRAMSYSERFWNLFTSGYQFYFMDRIAEDNVGMIRGKVSMYKSIKFICLKTLFQRKVRQPSRFEGNREKG